MAWQAPKKKCKRCKKRPPPLRCKKSKKKKKKAFDTPPPLPMCKPLPPARCGPTPGRSPSDSLRPAADSRRPASTGTPALQPSAPGAPPRRRASGTPMHRARQRRRACRAPARLGATLHDAAREGGAEFCFNWGGFGIWNPTSKSLCTKNSPNQYCFCKTLCFPTMRSGSRGGGVSPPPPSAGHAELLSTARGWRCLRGCSCTDWTWRQTAAPPSRFLFIAPPWGPLRSSFHNLCCRGSTCVDHTLFIRGGGANAETTPAGAPAAAADRTQRPDATGKNG